MASTKFEYSLDGGVTWIPAGSQAVAGTNTGCGAFEGRLPADDPTTGPEEFLPDGTVMQVRGNATDIVGNTSAWLTHYEVKVDNQFPDQVTGITLQAGWNLISLPNPPAQPLIDPGTPNGVKDGVLKDLFDVKGLSFQVHAYGNGQATTTLRPAGPSRTPQGRAP